MELLLPNPNLLASQILPLLGSGPLNQPPGTPYCLLEARPRNGQELLSHLAAFLTKKRHHFKAENEVPRLKSQILVLCGHMK
ncbi:hypothetical protein VULLAG_LOCUS21765 [Vulpes lagopus]